MVTFEMWQNDILEEERRIRLHHQKNNIFISEAKIKYMARANVGAPPSTGWK